MSGSLQLHGLQHTRLLEFAQTHVHWISDAIQRSHPLWFPSPPAFNLFQHQGLFQWGGSSYRVDWNFSFSINLSMNTQGWYPLGLIGFISLWSKGLSRVFSSTTVWKHQFLKENLSGFHIRFFYMAIIVLKNFPLFLFVECFYLEKMLDFIK